MFVFSGHLPMMDQVLNTEYKLNSSKRSDPSVGQIRTDIQKQVLRNWVD
jgi:hypothetical protein